MLSEQLLIEKAIKGDERSFEILIKSIDRKILNLLLNILKDEDEAMDAYQETFIKVHKNLSKFNLESSFFTWVYRIAVNTAYSDFKKKQKVQSRTAEFDVRENESLLNIADNHDGIDGEVYDRKQRIIESEIEKLSYQQKSVVYLKSYEGKKFREIAEILSINVGTAKKYFHRAVQNIKKKVYETEEV